MQLFVENAPECLGEGAELPLHPGSAAVADVCPCAEGGEGEGCQPFHPTDLAQ